MAFSEIAERGLVMLGCGKMGSAMLEGWLNRDLPPSSVFVIDPHPSDWLTAQGVSVNAALPDTPPSSCWP
jgi:pyrroline-5-carboxylate reductase